jgi:hypothetical protein
MEHPSKLFTKKDLEWVRDLAQSAVVRQDDDLRYVRSEELKQEARRKKNELLSLLRKVELRLLPGVRAHKEKV